MREFRVGQKVRFEGGATMKVLKVDPGGLWPLTVRLPNGEEMGIFRGNMPDWERDLELVEEP